MTTLQGVILKALGITNYCAVHYTQLGNLQGWANDYTGGQTQADVQKVLHDILVPMGLRIYFHADLPTLLGEAPSLNPVLCYPAIKAEGGAMFLPEYPWGYVEFNFGNPQMLYPQDENFTLITSPTPQWAETSPLNIVDDSPGLVTIFQNRYQQFGNAVGGLSAAAGLSQIVLSDATLPSTSNQGGRNYNNNLNSYVRFVNAVGGGFYLPDVTTAGLHVRDNTPCQLWSLRGQTPNYAGGNGTASPCCPPIAMGLDIHNYHVGGWEPPLGYSGYLVWSVANLEVQLTTWIKTKGGQGIIREQYSLSYPEIVLNYPKYWYHVLSAYGYNNQVDAVFAATGGDSFSTQSFNLCTPNDNATEPPSYLNPKPDFGSATPATIQRFFLEHVPNLLHGQIFADVDAAANNNPQGYPGQYLFDYILAGSGTATVWPRFSKILARMPYTGGLTGYEKQLTGSGVKTLLFSQGIGGSYYNYNLPAYYSLGIASRVWGANGSSSLTAQIATRPQLALNNFDVVLNAPVGPVVNPNNYDPNYTQDIGVLQQYVQNGGTLVIAYLAFNQPNLPNDTALTQLMGMTISTLGAFGTQVPVVSNPTHPIFAGYNASDINTAYAGAAVRAGTRVPLAGTTIDVLMNEPNFGPWIWVNHYGAGKVIVLPLVGNDNISNQGCGLYYLVQNAILWAKGLTPPAVYLTKYQLTTPGSGLSFRTFGEPTGPKLIFLSNPTLAPIVPGIGLNQNFFGVTSPGAITDQVSGGAINVGPTGGDIILNTSVPAQDWMVLYTGSVGIIPKSTTLRLTVQPV